MKKEIKQIQNDESLLIEGLQLHIYKDWENREDLIGLGILVNKVKDGLPFIISDVDHSGEGIPTDKQLVYTYEV